MKLITLFAVVAVASAAQLPARNYLPPQGAAQGNFQQNQSGQSSQLPNFIPLSGSGDTGNRRPQQEEEKNAVALKQEQEVTENGDFHYSYETSNGIKAEETGNTAQGGSQGSFSYKGDDGNTYTVTFTAGEGGFNPQGAHLPVPPPTPQEILLALEQNAKDEAAGIFDDGLYHPDVHGGPSAQGQKGSGSFQSSSSTSSGSFSSSSGAFGSANHQGSFNSNSGYKY